VVVDGFRLPADAVILAAGGAAWPSLGGCGLGYTLAAQAGHEIVEASPALVGLTTQETWPRICAGVTLPDVIARIDLPECRKESWRGVLLFTHTGLSGPLMLDLSGRVTTLLRTHARISLKLNLFPDISKQEWQTRLAGWRTDRGKKSVRNLLDESLPHSLAAAVCDGCGIDGEVRASGMTSEARDRLLEWMTALPVTITGSGGMAQAMVTHGGVSLRGVHPATLESRLVRGLFFAGEVLDLDGPCGGYNLQWAFSSGWHAGCSASLDQAQRGAG
jgi:predicted Rossmann fold flavoprotein